MGREFQDRSKILFGRGPDLAHLLGRAPQKGMTAITGRAQMGKSWLLTELARQLSQDASPLHSDTIQSLNLEERPSYLVGFTESLGETSDLLLRAVADLYTRWLSDSSYSQRAQIFWEQQKKDLVGNTAKAVGTIIEKVSKLGSKPGEAVGGLVSKTLEAVAGANRELLSGGVQLPRLQIEQGRELLAIVAQITCRPMVLVFDQWEKSPGIDFEAKILDSFVRHLDEWPPCHIFIGLRSEGKPSAAVKKLVADFPGSVEVYELPQMHLEEDVTTRAALLAHLRETVSATATLRDEELLEMISGYPRVVARWTDRYNAQRMSSSNDLKRVADDANAYRFPEFDVLLLRLSEGGKLSDGEQRLAIRLALLPATSNAENWKALRSVMLEGVEAPDLDGLKRKQVLESSPPPSYGHAKRGEAALEWCLKNCYEQVGQECESLIFSFASRIEGRSFASGLAALHPMALKVGLPSLPQALCQMGLYWFSMQNPDAATLLRAAEEVRRDSKHASVAHLLAMGLWSTLIATQEEVLSEQRDALLDELRQLTRAYPADARVRGYLAGGPSDTVRGRLWIEDSARDPKQDWEQQDALLDELRQMAHDYPQDADVRKELSEGLYQAAMREVHREERDRRLEGIGELARAFPHEEGLERLNGLLKELGNLARAYPQDADVREKLGTALVNTLDHAEQEGEAPQRCDALLEQLRELARAHPQDTAMRETLHIGLYNSFVEVKEKGDLQRRDALLDEIRRLSRANPQDADVRKKLAKGLLKTLIDADEERTPERRDALFEELRQLERDYPRDRAVSNELAMGLSKALHNAKQKGSLQRRDQLLGELLELARPYSGDELVSKMLKVVESAIRGDDVA
jgi:hypothetical protein